jgi:hypothetical protein
MPGFGSMTIRVNGGHTATDSDNDAIFFPSALYPVNSAVLMQ